MPKVSFVNYPLQYKNLKEEIDKAIFGVLLRGDLILRKDVEDFENSMANFLGVKYGIGINSCTDGLIFSLRAAGIGPGDEVITVSHTFFANIEAVHHCGATPVLIEVKDDFTMDEIKIEEAITNKTRAIIPVHLNGRSCDIEKIMEIANEHNLIVIEDAAQAIGAKFNGKMAGSFGLTSCYSFYPAKILGGAGDGGLVATNDGQTAEKIRLIRNHGQKTKDEIVLFGETSRLHNIQAAILNVKFKYLPSFIERRREIAKIYEAGLKDIEGVKTPPPPDSDEKHFDVFQNYVLRVEKRDELFSFLKEKEIETLIKDRIPAHKHPALGLDHFCLPFTEQLSNEIISLPMYPELTNDEVKYVADCVGEFYQ